ncbi:hypothetical protein AB0M20_42965 [Actinoplanes sp. NPDC051633]|uniref:hypothetical protein n=1 Tax=Actinoplanes sp. NPDC051633 TaxID=3155670 RepID=UPI00341F4368
MVGRIPDGPHRLAEAQAHLAREIAVHQAKLDRHAVILAAGRRPMGRPPVPMEQSTRVLRARRVVQAAIDASDKAASAGGFKDGAGKHRKPKYLPKVVADTTDPQSRIMPTRRGFVQGYNAQLAVSADQLILAVSVGQSTNDQASFVPMMKAAQTAAHHLLAVTGNNDHVIGTVLADAGYGSDANLGAAGPARLIALGKGRDQSKATARAPVPQPPPRQTTARQAMSHRLRTAEGKALYKPPWIKVKAKMFATNPDGRPSKQASVAAIDDAVPPSNRQSETSRKSSTGSPAAAWTPRWANSNSQPPPATSRKSTAQPPPDTKPRPGQRQQMVGTSQQQHPQAFDAFCDRLYDMERDCGSFGVSGLTRRA